MGTRRSQGTAQTMRRKLVGRSGRRRERGQRHDSARPLEEGGFSGCLNPLVWVRAVKCNSVIMTRYRSMRVPVSIRTNYKMTDIKALVDSGATENKVGS